MEARGVDNNKEVEQPSVSSTGIDMFAVSAGYL